MGSLHRGVAGVGGRFGDRRNCRQRAQPLSAAGLDQARRGGCVYCDRSVGALWEILIIFPLSFDIFRLPLPSNDGVRSPRVSKGGVANRALPDDRAPGSRSGT